MSIKSQGHSLILVKDHSDLKVKCLTFGLYTQVSDSGPQGPLVAVWDSKMAVVTKNSAEHENDNISITA